MDLRQLRYFKAVVEQGGFTAAAGALRVAQSALSRHVRALEDECGGLLLERGSRGAVPTPAGEVLLRRATFMLRQLEQTVSEVQAENANPRGLVRLGSSPSVAEVLFQPLAARFLARYPRVRLQLIEAIAPDPLASLLAGDLDIAVIPEPKSADGIAFTPLFLEEMCVFGPVSAPLLRAPAVDAEALLGVPLVVPVGVPWLPRLRPMLEDRVHELWPRVEIVSMVCMKQMVDAGLGFGVVPFWTVKRDVEAGAFAAAKIEGFSSRRGFALPTSRPVNRITKAFASAVQDEVQAMVGSGAL